jgi:hypothetical protein
MFKARACVPALQSLYVHRRHHSRKVGGFGKTHKVSAAERGRLILYSRLTGSTSVSR